MITANHAPSYGGGVQINGGSFTMKGGKISGNRASFGGGLYNAGGVLALDGGTITSNTATNGGGVYLQGVGAEVTACGTEISGNTATNGGGGLYNENSPVDWTGGTLTGNTAEQGGGAYNAGTLRLSGGSISANTATTGKGVYQAGTLEMSDKISLSDTDDIYLPSGRTVTNTGRISTSGVVAYLTTQDYAVGTRVLSGEFCAANYAKYVANIPAGEDELFIKTGYYEPVSNELVLFIDNRHIKDILRTFCHEMVHRNQNLADPEGFQNSASSLPLDEDKNLKHIESEAFLYGNLLFRQFTEKYTH